MEKKRFINPVAGTTREFKTEVITDTIKALLKDERIRTAGGSTITTKEEVIDDAE